MSERPQLSLFEATDPAPRTVTPRVTDEDRALARTLAPRLRFGTSSWSFPGWSGLLWQSSYDTESLAREGLRAYAQQPLFRTVCVDRSYYAPLRAEDVASYTKQLDDARRATPDLAAFRLVTKVWEELTCAYFPKHPRYGARAGERNPHFLDATRFINDVLAPCRAFGAYLGPFVFELTPMPPGAMNDGELTQRIEAFLAAMPNGFSWAFELRNAELLTKRWFATLRANGASHVFTYWTAMPSLRVQLARHGPLYSPHAVVRLMLPPFARYAEKKAQFAPFNLLQAVDNDMRDDVVAIARAAEAAETQELFVLANNKAEGSAPLTVREIARRLAAEEPRR